MVQRVRQMLAQVVQKVPQGEDGSDQTLNVIVVFTQVITLARAIHPVLQWGVELVKMITRKCYRSQVRDVVITGHCKVRSTAYAATDEIIELIQHQPGGYSFWGLLPQRGRHNKNALRKAIADQLLTTFFSPLFLTVLLQSALTQEGRPCDTPLYKWLVSYVYGNNIQRLYSDWLKACKQELTEV
jgi:hypothetical protein